MMREITIDDCLKLQSKFRAYCERAEQHEFPLLLIVDDRLTATINKHVQNCVACNRQPRAVRGGRTGG